MIAVNDTRVYNAGSVERIPLGEGRTVRVAGREIAIFRTRHGTIHAVQADCPHKGGPLADGIVGGSVVVCPLHSRGFDLTTGEPLREGCPALRTYRATVSSAGDVLVTIPRDGDDQDG